MKSDLLSSGVGPLKIRRNKSPIQSALDICVCVFKLEIKKLHNEKRVH